MAFDIDRMQKDIRKLRKYLERTPKLPTPEEIHSLRTHARRFEAAFQVLALASSPKERKALHILKRIRRRAGKVRDLDVFTGHATLAPPEQERDCLVHLLEYLGAERYRRSRQLHSLTTQKGRLLQQWLKRVSEHLATLASADDENHFATLAMEGTAASAFRLRQALDTPVRLNKNNLHAYRLKVKKLRYVLQMTKNPGDAQFIATLGEVKDAIGDWHDWQELVTVASEQLQHGPECGLLRSFQIVSEQKYKHALSVTNEMRKHSLRRSLPEKKPSANSNPAAAEAVARITPAISA